MTAQQKELLDMPAKPAALPAVQEPSAVVPMTPMAMLQLAIEKGAGLEQMERLMALQERWEANEARKAFVVAKSAFKSEPITLTKNKHVSYPNAKGGETEYDHATLDRIADVLSPALSKHNLTYSWETKQGEGGMISVSCVLSHVLGHSERVTLQASPDQSGGKNNIQAVGSTVTYLQRYTLLAITGLSTTGSDDEGKGSAGAALISAEQHDELLALIRDTNTDATKFLAYLRVEALEHLPFKQFAQAKQALLSKQRKPK